MVQLNIDKQGN